MTRAVQKDVRQSVTGRLESSGSGPSVQADFVQIR